MRQTLEAARVDDGFRSGPHGRLPSSSWSQTGSRQTVGANDCAGHDGSPGPVRRQHHVLRPRVSVSNNWGAMPFMDCRVQGSAEEAEKGGLILSAKQNPA